jgi:hypothetical protein
MMTYDKINLMVPTRRRIDHLAKLISSTLRFATTPERIAFTFLVDDDDEETHYYLNQHGPRCDWQKLLWHEKMPHLGRMYNKIYAETKFQSAIVTMIGDDMVFETENWDADILSEINDRNGWCIASCDDGYIQHGRIFVNLFTTRKVVIATGGPFMSEEFPMDFIDVVWTELAKRSGIDCYLHNVMLRHEHSSVAGDTTRERLQSMRGSFQAGIRRAMEIGYGYVPNLLEAMRANP